MGNFLLTVLVPVLSVVVALGAFLWEFILIGRRRLGYRVQMDTLAADEVSSEHAGVLKQIGEDGRALTDPSFVLLRIENNGATYIDSSDYAVVDPNPLGIRVEFPERKVRGMAITELSDDFLKNSFRNRSNPSETGRNEHREDSGLRVQGEQGVIELPRVPLNRHQHYKVLVALEGGLESPAGRRTEPLAPKVSGGIKGGVPRRKRGRITETRSRTTISWPWVALIGLLMAGVGTQFVGLLTRGDAAPLDCAEGHLTLTGSTAFEPTLREAADRYRRSCPNVSFSLVNAGSQDGLVALDQAGRDGAAGADHVLAFSDGSKQPDEFPQLLPRPIAFQLFTLVANDQDGVQDLPLVRVKEIFAAGKYRNWRELNGAGVPIRIVDRNGGSGTRNTLERRVLGALEPGRNSDDCQTLKPDAPGGVARCERDNTGAVLDAVARTPGAIGYAELGAAVDRRDLKLVRIDGQPATLVGAEHGAYPFGETEYAYTYGEPHADSPVASYLRFLTQEIGQDIVRSHGDRPCAELENPVLCRPTAA